VASKNKIFLVSLLTFKIFESIICDEAKQPIRKMLMRLKQKDFVLNIDRPEVVYVPLDIKFEFAWDGKNWIHKNFHEALSLMSKSAASQLLVNAKSAFDTTWVHS